MRRIITISREFGSGGRELGKRLAESLGIAYYDREIVTALAEKERIGRKIYRTYFRTGRIALLSNHLCTYADDAADIFRIAYQSVK